MRHQRFMLPACSAFVVWAWMSPAQAQEIPSIAAPAVALEQATNIKAQPLSILSKFPLAGPAMARYVAQALTKEPAAVDAVLSIIPDTSPEQAAAIGAGMVRAIRALGSKQGDAVRSIMYKVMQSDNKWLKTTFAAIGPYGGRAVSTGSSAGAADLKPLPTADNAGGGGAVGTRLAEDESRVGPSVLTNLTGASIGVRPDSFESHLNNNLTRYGMIVAIIKSDADDNDVLPISP